MRAMAVRLDKVPKINREALTDFEALLLQLVLQRDECIQELKDEIARLKGEKEKPKIKPSRLGHRYFQWTVKPDFSRRQRSISHRKTRYLASGFDCINLHQH